MGDYSLFELEKDYYLGNYQSCINKANSMPDSKEAIYYMCLSYCHLKKYDNLDAEISKSSHKCVELVGLYATYCKNEHKRPEVCSKLDSMVANKTIEAKDDLSRMVASAIFVREKQYTKALAVLDRLDSLAAQFSTICVLLLMHRVDVAERKLSAMQSKDDYATLTLLATAQVRLAKNIPREAYDIARELEDKYKATPLLQNLQAAAAICLGDYDTARQHCENSLDLDNDNLEALINMIHVLSVMRDEKSSKIRDRHLNRLKTLYPNHSYVEEFNRIDVELGA